MPFELPFQLTIGVLKATAVSIVTHAVGPTPPRADLASESLPCGRRIPISRGSKPTCRARLPRKIGIPCQRGAGDQDQLRLNGIGRTRPALLALWPSRSFPFWAYGGPDTMGLTRIRMIFARGRRLGGPARRAAAGGRWLLASASTKVVGGAGFGLSAAGAFARQCVIAISVGWGLATRARSFRSGRRDALRSRRGQGPESRHAGRRLVRGSGWVVPERTGWRP